MECDLPTRDHGRPVCDRWNKDANNIEIPISCGIVVQRSTVVLVHGSDIGAKVGTAVRKISIARSENKIRREDRLTRLATRDHHSRA